jgi:hypothetical protein
LAKRQAGVIEVHEIGAVIVDQLVLPQQPFLDEAHVAGRRGFEPLAVALVVPCIHL